MRANSPCGGRFESDALYTTYHGCLRPGCVIHTLHCTCNTLFIISLQHNVQNGLIPGVIRTQTLRFQRSSIPRESYLKAHSTDGSRLFGIGVAHESKLFEDEMNEPLARTWPLHVLWSECIVAREVA